MNAYDEIISRTLQVRHVTPVNQSEWHDVTSIAYLQGYVWPSAQGFYEIRVKPKDAPPCETS
jgi:hypothetical protein